jgi:hypothetical protein
VTFPHHLLQKIHQSLKNLLQAIPSFAHLRKVLRKKVLYLQIQQNSQLELKISSKFYPYKKFLPAL